MYLFAATIFLSAFLLFQVQPLIARYILPWFGGTPGVWSVTLLFFQTILLGGYAYAHVLKTRLKPSAQLLVHLILLAGAAALLPIVPPESLKPEGDSEPISRILLLLLVSVGLPYFVLASTGPLLQAWFASTYREKSPYALYALSNIGSLLALVSYPFLVESIWGRYEQAFNWSVGFGTFALLCAVVAVVAFRAARQALVQSNESAPSPSTGSPEAPAPETHTASVGRGQIALWIALPACGTALLLAFTNHLTVDVASVPLLWILPLALYLLTFILTFAGEKWYPRRLFVALGVLAASSSVLLDHFHVKLNVWTSVAGFSGAMFLLCMVCHGEVYRLRPHAEKLTSFYLCVSLGGAIGGFSVAILAPNLFDMYLEYPIAVLGTLGLMLLVHAKDKRSPLYEGRPRAIWGLLIVITLGIVGGFGYKTYEFSDEVIAMDRNFYGVFRVQETPEESEFAWTRALVSGTTVHGIQFMEGDSQLSPTSYFAEHSGIGVAFQTFPRRPRKIAVLGLGVGTLASYGRRGDFIRFYEINPVCVDMANEYFTFLKHTEAEWEIALGDARLVMEQEEPQEYDIIVMDAFSSDSVPVHLLTTDAFAIYKRHLKPDGVIAVNISNRYLDLRQVVVKSAQSIDLYFAGWLSVAVEARAIAPAHWVICTKNLEFMRAYGQKLEELRTTWPRLPGDEGQWPVNLGMPMQLQSDEDATPWTDDYSNIFKVIR